MHDICIYDYIFPCDSSENVVLYEMPIKFLEVIIVIINNKCVELVDRTRVYALTNFQENVLLFHDY